MKMAGPSALNTSRFYQQQKITKNANIMTDELIPNPQSLIVPRRKITGSSAILLPFADDHSIDWKSFDAHVERTCQAGLIPAINMDTGYANLIDEATRVEVLQRTQRIAGDSGFATGYVAGAFVADSSGEAFNLDAYAQQIDSIQKHEGIPVIFQTFGLTEQSDEGIVSSYNVDREARGPICGIRTRKNVRSLWQHLLTGCLRRPDEHQPMHRCEAFFAQPRT